MGLIQYISSRGILLIITLLLLFTGHSYGQEMGNPVSDTLKAKKDAIDIIFNIIKIDSSKIRGQSDRKVFFSLAPLTGGSGDQGLSISSINASFYLGNPVNTKLSNINFYPNTNFTSLFQFIVAPNLWAEGNRWNINGRFEISRIRQETYGVGSGTSPDTMALLDFSHIRTYLNINRQVVKNLFLGAGYKLDNYYNIDYSGEIPNASFIDYDYGTSSRSLSSGVAVNFLYDNRKNPINPLQGFYSNITLRMSSPFFGSDYKWNSVIFDLRKYFSFSTGRHKTFAIWGLYWTTWGEVPYLDLPGTRLYPEGWSGRGYAKGRYRGKQMIYGEAEYRFDITKNGLWGGVMFVNAQSFSEPESGTFEYLLPAGGVGLRLKFNKYSDSNLTSDIAFGKNSFFWYLGLNEAF